MEIEMLDFIISAWVRIFLGWESSNGLILKHSYDIRNGWAEGRGWSPKSRCFVNSRLYSVYQYQMQ